jgi:RsmE family RNA methyltransferase
MIFFDSNLDGTISSPQSKHLIACRVKKDDIIFLSNFKGQKVKARITLLDKVKNQYKYSILEQKKLDNPPEKILFQSLISKNYLEKLVEIIPIIGITKVYLFVSTFSPKQKISMERLQSILIRSHEQSENLFLAEIKIIEKYELHNLLNQYKPVILDQLLGNNVHKTIPSEAILVGSEGGFSPQEITEFLKLDPDFINLGDKVLPAWLAGYTYFATTI